jgi:protein phosphatase
MSQAGVARLDMAGLSDVGLRRELNEDTYEFDLGLGLLVVADGMGGHEAGEIASSIAVETVVSCIDAASSRLHQTGEMPLAAAMVTDAVLDANRRIHDINLQRGKLAGRGMGTTLVGIWLPVARSLISFNVGDSRLYRLRGGRLLQLTRDHTAYEQWLASGGVGQQPGRNVLLRAVGPWPHVEVDVTEHEVRQGDLLLLCSDGLTGMVDDATIEHRLAGSAAEALPDVCADLVEMAKANGGLDDITVVLARVIQPG